MVINGRYLKIK